MENGEVTAEDRFCSLMRIKKQALLNKFLSKTYHMIDQCEPVIAAWSTDGSNFVIKDVEEFAKTVLPRYFKHSKFASFVRQLNFYSFRKLRSEPDVRVSTKSVRFAHEYFRRGEPELLHRIQRITKSQDASSMEIQSLKDDIAQINEQLITMSSRMDYKLQRMASAVELDYQQRMANIALSYQALSQVVKSMAMTPNSSSPPSTQWKTEKEIQSPNSPRSSMSPLETLSGVAALISDGSQPAEC